MGENEKLGFTCEEVPFDISTFNRFFGATTDWVEDEKSATIPWNGNSCGKLTVASPNLQERMVKLKTDQECIAEKYKPIADWLFEEIQKSCQKPIPPVPEDTAFKSLSEKTAKALEKSCSDYLETLSELNPCLERLIAQLAKPTKRKKHYKPKFTL